MNSLPRLRAAAVIAALLFAAGASAHPPGADGQHDDHHHADPARIRTWTNAKTGEVVRGAFLAARAVDGVVRVSIERETGDVVVFPLADLAEADRAEAQRRIDEVKATNERLAAQAAMNAAIQPEAMPAANATMREREPEASTPASPAQAAPFKAFGPFVSTRWDDRWLYVESDGLPHTPLASLPPGTKADDAKKTIIFSHTMMVGITAWQQQVPLPQNYRGANAWQIPLKPELADKPVSAKEQLFRGAIALAANGVPIFNPIKNDGKTDSFLAGELDEFGGHCGRADDYHYHIAPTHLQKYLGAGQPIAYALDGFPIYGLFDPSAKPDGPDAEKCCPLGSHEKLDGLNGHFAPAPAGSPPGARGLYHYHASVKYPYLNGGMRGVVTVKDDQIDPQPRASSPRAALPPLRGAKITGFKAMGKSDEPAWSLEYMLGGKKHFVNYRLENAKWIFDFVDPLGATKTDTYDATSPQRKQGGRGGRGEGGGDRRPREDGAGGGNRPPRPPRDAAPQTAPEPATRPAATGFALSSADVTDGRLSIECTCDGKSRAPSLSWGTPPEGTKAFAVVMHHITRDNDTHVYMVVANIPPAARELKSGDVGVGTWGQNSVNRKNAYAPPCSQGPGDKTYTITLYALSAETVLPKGTPCNRDALLAAIKDSTLETTTLEVKYARAAK
jgi:phosphatidylethanolamine-binding protein (PEBP) family uncharacterized protein